MSYDLEVRTRGVRGGAYRLTWALRSSRLEETLAEGATELALEPGDKRTNLPVDAGAIIDGHDAALHPGSMLLRVRTGEGTVVSPLAEGAFSMGRPADIHQGMSQVVPLAVTLPVKLEGPGIYQAELLIDGEVKKVIEFEALDRPPQN